MESILEFLNYINELKEVWSVGAFVCSITFQLTAGLLLVNNTSVSRKGIINAYCAQNSGGIAFEEDGILADDWALSEVIRTSWINRFAFLYLFVGYLLSIWAEGPTEKIYSLMGILALVTVLYFLTNKIAIYKGKQFGELRIEDIPLEHGVMWVILDSNEKSVETFKDSFPKKEIKKKYTKSYVYNFDYEKEFSIYRKACGKKLSRHEIRMIGDKIFCRYSDWSTYVENKYQDVTIDSLYEFKRFLNHKMRISKNYSGAYGAIISPFMFMFLGALSTMVTSNIIIIIMFYVFVLCSPVKDMLKEYSKDTLEVVFYEDYIEVIERLIKKKENEKNQENSRP